MVDTVICIPARYGSTRFPGKPLIDINGQSLLSHVCDVAKKASQLLPNVTCLVATDDERIRHHAMELGVHAVMTSPDIPCGTDRVFQAVSQYPTTPKWVINLQGDAPLIPVSMIQQVIEALRDNSLEHSDIVSPVVPLTWQSLDELVEHKLENPFSGTTAIIGPDSRFLWFSKNIIPAIRKRDDSNPEDLSPIFQHVGLYGFRMEALEKVVSMPSTKYENLEGLEQLRWLENGIAMRALIYPSKEAGVFAGVDTPGDAERVRQLLTNNT